MPLYEYQCEACGHRFEVIQKYSDARVDTCTKCGGVVTKLFSSPAIQFKGSGWYITDYARAGKSEGGSGATKDDTGGAKSEDSKSDSKSESKSDSKSESKTETKSEGKSEGKSESKADSKSESKPTSSSTSS